jgi:hypothetical protein
MLKKCDRDSAGVPWLRRNANRSRDFILGRYTAVAACYDYGKVLPDGASEERQGAIGGSDLAEMTE